MELKPSRLRPARAQDFQKGHPSGARHTVRLFCGERLRLWVQWKGEAPSPPFFIYTDLPNGHRRGSWREIPMVPGEQAGRWELEIPAARQGSFLAQVRYRGASGETRFDPEGYLHVAVDPASMSDLRLYTLISPASGTVDDWIERLGEIRRLGFNAVHVLPVTAMDASASPYSAASLFSVDPHYLPPGTRGDGLKEWRRFVAALKQHDLRLCVDLVLNHVGVTSEVARLRPEFFAHDPQRPDGLKRAGAADGDHWVVWEDLARLDYEHPEPEVREELWAMMTEYARFWTSFAAETGGFIRLDNLHSTPEAFLSHLVSSLRGQWPDLPIFCELFSTEETVRRLSWKYGLSLCLATPWTAPYAYQVRGQLRWIHQQQSTRYLFPLASHDSGSPAREYGGVEATVPRYVSAALFSTGQTGAVQGNEDGYGEKIPFIGKPGPLSWPPDPALREKFRRINELHASSPVFHGAGNLRFVDSDHGALLAALRWHGEERFLLLSNLDPRGTHTVVISRSDLAAGAEPGPETRPLKLVDRIGSEAFEWSADSHTFTLGPAAALVFEIRTA
ncbi:MAG: hypothetical protein J0L75_01305 [Spirochaetes bacterium]|nr:hypothetical protein [Spirochaetota bacterium]